MRRAVFFCQRSLPNGAPRSTLVRSAASSASSCGSLTRLSQSSGRRSGPRCSNDGTIDWPSPAREDHGHCSARPTSPARSGFRFYVPDHRQEVLVLLDRKGLEPALPNVSARVVPAVVAQNVGCKQPLHPSTQLTISVGPEHQVEVVRHQTPSQDPHRHACTGLLDKFDEPLVVVILVKNILLRVAAVQNMIANSSDGSSCGSWHSTMLP